MPKKTEHELRYELGQGINYYRVLAGLSQRQLADSLGVAHQTVQRYETGERNVMAHDLPRIAEALGCPISVLFDSPSAEEMRFMQANQRQLLQLFRAFKRLSPERRQLALELVFNHLNNGNNTGSKDHDTASSNPADE